MSTRAEFNHNIFSKHLNDAYFEIINMKREEPDVRFRIETNKYDENVRVNVIDKGKIAKIITFKEGKRHSYNAVKGGHKNVD